MSIFIYDHDKANESTKKIAFYLQSKKEETQHTHSSSISNSNNTNNSNSITEYFVKQEINESPLYNNILNQEIEAGVNYNYTDNYSNRSSHSNAHESDFFNFS